MIASNGDWNRRWQRVEVDRIPLHYASPRLIVQEDMGLQECDGLTQQEIIDCHRFSYLAIAILVLIGLLMLSERIL